MAPIAACSSINFLQTLSIYPLSSLIQTFLVLGGISFELSPLSRLKEKQWYLLETLLTLVVFHKGYVPVFEGWEGQHCGFASTPNHIPSLDFGL